MKQDLVPASISLHGGWSSIFRICLLAAFGLGFCISASGPAAEVPTGCLACHESIEPIVNPDSGMAQAIEAFAEMAGDPAGCAVCHGGDPAAATKEQAHQGKAFYPDPGSPWINAQTCGQCHDELVKTQWNSLMMTEAGKIQGATWAFGSLEGYDHRWGNYDANNLGERQKSLVTEDYCAYMDRLKIAEPQVFPDKMTSVPDAPTDMASLAHHPEQAVFTYLRGDCLRCHLAVKGRQVRGDYRGMGCSACHIPYGNEGFYEGGDEAIPTDKPGHMLVHSIQATREAKVTVNDKQYSGIPVETCNSCHDRGKRIGVSYQGLMESAYASPYTEGGGGQIGLHTKHYIAMKEDVHYLKGMFCQDCHTSVDVHGDGYLAGTNLAQVEIECTDCHGTPQAYPWELPLGYGDEFAQVSVGTARGVARELPTALHRGTGYQNDQGYLRTARGNPFTNVVRKGNTVIVHTAAGNDIELRPLKLLLKNDELELEAKVAMDNVKAHIDKTECYSCHSSWAPQCYGCHVKIDYSQGKRSFDWIAAGHEHKDSNFAADAGEQDYDTFMPGEIKETRSYLRWETPALAINGEGRVTPVMPGCQVSATVIGADGETILKNHIFRTLPESEGSGAQGQLGIDMSPVQPHTVGEARPCHSCHLSEKAAGYGIAGGRLNREPNEPVIVDLMTADAQILPAGVQTQIEAIPALTADWSRFVTEDGKQLQTVGSHFSLSRPLSNEQRRHMDRQGVCLACHKEIPDKSLAAGFLHHVAEYAGQLPKTAEQHNNLVHKILMITAWGQLLAVAGGAMAGLLCCILWFRIRQRRHGRPKGNAV